MKVRALVPLKDLVDAKSRLSGLLLPAERRALAQAMAEDVLATLLRHPLVAEVILLSDDSGAAMLAQKYNAQHWPETATKERGLNNVISQSCDRLFAQGDSPVVVLHADLPCLSGDDLTAIIEAQTARRALIVACDRHAVGTNLLAFSAQNRPEFLFGPDSCARHCASAMSRHMTYYVMLRSGTSLDIDMPEDVKLLLESAEQGTTGHSAQLLLQPYLRTRIRTQLDSMTVSEVSADQLIGKVNSLNG